MIFPAYTYRRTDARSVAERDNFEPIHLDNITVITN